jgi:hypothetical protein
MPKRGGRGGRERDRVGPRRPGGLSLRPRGGSDFEIVHPRCIEEMEPDYVEGIDLWRAGDPEAARDALRFALEGCGDNLWVHVALGRLALEEFGDPGLARGHFGYAFELVWRALPPDFAGRVAPDLPPNRPFYDAIDGLAASYEALGRPDEAGPLRRLAARLAGGAGGPKGRAEL